MKPYQLLLLSLLATLASTGTQAKPTAKANGWCELFDFGWQFEKDGKTVSVDLPHDWDIYCAPSATGASGNDGGYYPGGRGTYTKRFATPKAERAMLHFEGVYHNATVTINGQKAGQHAYGYTPFTVDITPYLYKDRRLNEVKVVVDNSDQPNCRWYSGSGIYRHVWLQTMPAFHIAENGIQVTTPEATAEKATVWVSISLTNSDSIARHLDDIEVSFNGGSFKPDATSLQTMERWKEELRSVKAGTTCVLSCKYTVASPRLWSPATPSLYSATVRLKEEGRVIDERTVRFGIRTISFDARRGFLLNGKPLKLNGACIHHDDGVLGAMAFDAAEVRKVRLMKEAGFNLIRTSHNPSSRALLDACDSIGMLAIGEVFDGWRTEKTAHDYHEQFDSCARADVYAMVQRDRLHPSIISWSIGNEVIERKEIGVVTTARKLKSYILDMDNTRPVTEALCAWDRDWEIYDPHAEVLDVVGYNYMMFKHESDHQRAPERIMWQTESYPRDAFRNWQRTQQYPYIVGDMVWTGLDYLGESGIGRYYYEGETAGEHWQARQFPWHGAYCGDVDMTGWRKPISHYRDMLWNDVRKPYMAVREPNGYKGQIKETQWSVWPTWESWNWTGWEGKPIQVEVYTKEPSVALYLDKQLVGKQSVSEETGYKATFTLPYQPGELQAVTSAGSATLATAGRPAGLRLTPDRTTISADGQDLCYVTLEVIDAEGRVVPDAAIACEVSVSGTATLMAAASADLTDLEPKTSSKVTTWKGRAVIVVRSGQRRGKATVSVRSQLPEARTLVSTR